MTFVILGSFLSISAGTFGVQLAYGQVHTPDTEADATPISVILYINEDKEGNGFFNPSEFNIKEGEEILILNNSTQEHSFTNGESPDDLMAGTKFDTGLLKPGSFAEYLALNVSPGEYSFHSSGDPESMKGKMIISVEQ